MRTLRIFVSSPRDVGSERALAARVIERLRFEFRGLIDVEPVFWEQMPMRASDTFQAQIPLASESDICVFILWSWFGTPLPETYLREDGSRYTSGTEYEFETALEAHAQRGMPDILVYRKTTELRASIQNREQVLERLAQRDAVQSFIDRYFRGEGGAFKAAFRDFPTPADFEEMLEAHLRDLIRAHVEADSGTHEVAAAMWAQSPFRGLEIFDAEHALIFCGRTQVISEILDTLRRRAESARPLILVTGISGAGKSSLVRAGVVPMLVQPRVVEEAIAWRRAVVRPSDGGGNGPLSALAEVLLQETALPELAVGGTTAQSLADVLRDKPTALAPSLAITLDRIAEHARQSAPELDPAGVARLVLVIDQFEEIFAPTIAAAERDAFVSAILAIVASGQIWVLITLRADFYPRCGELPDAFGDLIRGDGTFELRPPRAAEIAQMIRRPALIAGLAFERNPETDEGLDDVLRDAAATHPAALPLLQFALDELYKRRRGNLLRFSDYEALGGLEGALRQRAEEEFDGLPKPVQDALPTVLSALVRIGLEDDAIAGRRAPRAQLSRAAGAIELADAFIAARLFVADRGDDEGATIAVAHEALLREWPRASAWIDANKEMLRSRARVAAAAMIWEASDRDPARLLPAGKALAEAASLLGANEAGLSAVTADFITASQHRAAHHQRRRKELFGAAVAVLLAMLTAAGWYYDGYVDTKVRYYGNFSKKFGIFVPAGQQVSEVDARHRWMTIKMSFTGRYGPVERIDAVNGHGVCPQFAPIETYLGAFTDNMTGVNRLCYAELSLSHGQIAKESWFDFAGRSVFEFNFSNQTTAEFYSRNGVAISMSGSGASRIRFTRIDSGPQRGRDKTTHYLDAYGRPEPDRKGKYGQEYDYDDRGQVIRLTALGVNDQPILPRGAAATIQLNYDDRGNPIGYAAFDDRGAAMRDPTDGGMKELREFDRYGNEIAVTMLDQNDNPMKGKDKYVKMTITYNEFGDAIEMAFWDRYGQRVRNANGVARITRKFDEFGRWVEERYFDESGQPIVPNDGAEVLRATYNQAGYLSELRYFDHTGKPVRIKAGYAWLVRDFDDNGQEIRETYEDVDGTPIELTQGYAQIKREYDTVGRLVLETYFDKIGNQVSLLDGYAGVKTTYDPRGNPTVKTRLGLDGNPVQGKDGWARETNSFDDRGDVIETDYLNPAGGLTPIDVGYSSLHYTFDARGNKTAVAYYASLGQLIDKTKGCSTIEYTYDERSEQTGGACKDRDGKLVITPTFPYARWQETFDTHGNVTEETFFDDQNLPIINPRQGFARAKFTYNNDDDLAEAEFFDQAGRPILPPKIGCARVVLTYDKGRRIGRQCVSAPPAPADSAPQPPDPKKE